MPNRPALGLIETRGLVSAIEAADAAAKSAKVVVTSVEITMAALVTIKLEGDLGAVAAAVEAASEAASRVGELVAAHVIPRPDDALDVVLDDSAAVHPFLSRPARAKGSILPTHIPDDETVLASMTVSDLRRLAREQKNVPIGGREISRANKTELLRILRECRLHGDSTQSRGESE